MAGREGIEPSSSGLESEILPLDKRPKEGGCPKPLDDRAAFATRAGFEPAFPLGAPYGIRTHESPA